MIIVSFDIGLRTCSVACEEYVITERPQVPTVCYQKSAEATDEMKEYVKTIGTKGRVIHLDKRDLGDKKAFFAGYAYQNLYKWCRELHEHLQSADVVLIEQQMKCNNIAQALMYHLQAYLMITYEGKNIQLYPSKNKTRVLGAPLKIENDKGKIVKVTKYQRKKWSTMCAGEMLKIRGDDKWHDFIFKENKSKKDDLSDVLMQALSYIVTQSMAQPRKDDTSVPSDESSKKKKRAIRVAKVKKAE